MPGDSVTGFRSPTGLFIYAYVPSIGVPTEALPESSVPTLCPTSHIVSTSVVPAYGYSDVRFFLVFLVVFLNSLLFLGVECNWIRYY